MGMILRPCAECITTLDGHESAGCSRPVSYAETRNVWETQGRVSKRSYSGSWMEANSALERLALFPAFILNQLHLPPRICTR
jgi:hypothetical protein